MADKINKRGRRGSEAPQNFLRQNACDSQGHSSRHSSYPCLRDSYDSCKGTKEDLQAPNSAPIAGLRRKNAIRGPRHSTPLRSTKSSSVDSECEAPFRAIDTRVSNACPALHAKRYSLESHGSQFLSHNLELDLQQRERSYSDSTSKPKTVPKMMCLENVDGSQTSKATNGRKFKGRSRFMSFPTLKISSVDDEESTSTSSQGSDPSDDSGACAASRQRRITFPVDSNTLLRPEPWGFRTKPRLVRSDACPSWNIPPSFLKGTCSIENEGIYRGLLRSLLHPLGSPDKSMGLRPGDLVDHLREVFEIDRDDHEFLVKEEALNKPKYLQANLTIIEGQGIYPVAEKKEIEELYFLVFILNGSQKSLKISPKTSPSGSPRMSPKSRRSPNGQTTPDHEEMLRTHTVKMSENPQWNEEFQLLIDDPISDEIHILMCDEDADKSIDHRAYSSSPTAEKSSHHGFKNMFKAIRHVTEHSKIHDGCWSRIIIPVRDIPSHGCDWWWDLGVGSHGKSKVKGRLRIKLNVSHRRESFMEEEFFSIEDYYQATQQVYEHVTRTCKEKGAALDAQLPPQERRILDCFAVSHKISQLSQNIVHVIALLEWSASNDNVVLTEVALNHALQDLQMTWVAQQLDINTVQKMPLTDVEISMYRAAATKYISCVCDRLDDTPSLFPPAVDNINKLKSKLAITLQLAELDLWESKCTPLSGIATKILNQLQGEVKIWTLEKIAAIRQHDLVKDYVIPEMTNLGELINIMSSHCSAMGVVRSFFNSLGITYYRVVSFKMESLLSPVVKELIMEMNKYQRRYHNFAVNIRASSRLSLRVYFAVRKFYNITRDNTSRRDVFRLSISHYQEWFQETLVFWVQSFRTECMNRIERALEIDKDVVVATSLVKFSNSSVDVISCFAKITEEWRQIDYHDPDSALMGVTKITDLICDGARLYADRIQSILERNGYYDNNHTQFDVTDRLCITLNNIEHVRRYLSELPNLLDWESVALLVSTRYENERIGNQAMTTLRRLVDTGDKEIVQKSSLLLMQISEKMKVDMARFMELFTKSRPEKASSVDNLIHYLKKNMETLQDRLMGAAFPRCIDQLWKTVLTILDEQLAIGEKPDYFRHQKMHLRALLSFFARGGLPEDKVENPMFDIVKTRLELNSMCTEDLILDYFNSLANNMNTPLEYVGHLAFKVAYLEETRGNITLYVKVVRATDLPALDRSGYSDPYVVVSLQPETMFRHHKEQRTRVVERNLNPVFNTIFQFPNIPKEYIQQPGAVIVFSISDHDTLVNDDFAGEVIIHLSSVEKIKLSECVDSKPVIMMPLKRASTPTHGPYRVLQERIHWDKEAKLFINSRKKFLDCTTERTDKPSKLSGFFTFFTGGGST